ncbi:Protein dopey-1 [Fasciolopsis buskii]|uniref:Protein dopey-1 n=1 Tax=Fasciolopsis buskii TaxID=27845 RepID=A0A8E0VP88_9TREM|nr:Protein dopey-1 [Fasciolopsis buski]
MRLQVNLLHIFYAWLVEQPRLVPPDLLLALLRDVINIPIVTSVPSGSTGTGSVSLPSVAAFVLMKIFHEYLNSVSISDDKREQREIQHMASFLDVVYRSDEKDRVSTFLTVILNNVFPYLRVRMTSNSDRFQAASRLLASISSYQYTRRSWRREVLDLLYEPVFFQMTPIALQSWNVIIDNLMTQDKNTFKEALVRLTFSQPAGLNLFSNKEVEHDLRAACLKKLSYLVYASESDQYAKSMPDLLGKSWSLC